MKHQAAGELPHLRTAGKDHRTLEDNLGLLEIDAEGRQGIIFVTSTRNYKIILINAREKQSVKNISSLEEPVVKQAPVKYCKLAAPMAVQDRFGALYQLRGSSSSKVYSRKVYLESSTNIALSTFLVTGLSSPYYGTPRTRPYSPYIKTYIVLVSHPRDVHTTIAKCERCVQCKSCYRHNRLLQLFPASEPFKFVAMNILGPLIRTNEGKQYIRIMME